MPPVMYPISLDLAVMVGNRETVDVDIDDISLTTVLIDVLAIFFSLVPTMSRSF